jgi:bla regulator protein BlaR1
MSALLETLWRASFQGALFIAAVWLVCRLAPRLPAALRCGLWWAACLKLLVGLVWVSPVELPVLPASAALYIRNVDAGAAARPGPHPLAPSPTPPAPSLGEGENAYLSSSPLPGRAGGVAGEEPGVRARAGEILPWGLAALWAAGLLVQLALTVRQLRRTRRVVRQSEPLRAGWIAAAFAELLERLGLAQAPELRGSAEVDTPQAVGLLRPVVLLPDPGLERLSPQELSMTLCHELVHLRRKDLWLGWIPVLAQRIFFFHPLAALAAREYSLAREAACDAEVLRVLGSAPQAYGRLLLRWGVAPRETGLAAAGASPSLSNLKRRLQMLQHTSESTRRPSAWWWLAGAVALAGLIPFQMIAQQAPEAPEPPEAPVVVAPAPPAPAAPAGYPVPAVAPVAPVEPAAPGEPAPPVESAIHPVPVPGTPVAPPAPTPVATPRPATAPVAVVAWVPTPRPAPAPSPAPAAPPAAAVKGRPAPPPAPPVPPAPPRPPKPPKETSYSYGWSDDGESWILMTGKNNVTMSGSTDDIARVKKLRGNADADILWFRHDGKEYVVKDAALLKVAKDLWKPVTELGGQQAKLGAEQAALGAKQAALGGRQAELGGRQAALGAQMAALAAKAATRDDDESDGKQEELAQKMDELGRQQAELGRQQEQYSEPQEKLGRQQEALGRQQEVASKKAEKEMKSLFERAIQNGAAQEVR